MCNFIGTLSIQPMNLNVQYVHHWWLIELSYWFKDVFFAWNFGKFYDDVWNIMIPSQMSYNRREINSETWKNLGVAGVVGCLICSPWRPCGISYHALHESSKWFFTTWYLRPTNEVWDKCFYTSLSFFSQWKGVSRGVCMCPGVCVQGVYVCPGGCGRHCLQTQRQTQPPVETASDAGGALPTGMHSCCHYVLFWAWSFHFFLKILWKNNKYEN